MTAERPSVEVLRYTLGIPPSPEHIATWEDLPRSVNIDLVENICNLACPHCPLPERMADRTRALHAGEFVRPPFIDADVLFRAIDEMSEWPEPPTLQITANGEPLMHPRFLEIVGYAKQKGLKMGLTTNGILLDSEMSKKLLNSGISLINISVDTPDEEQYADIRRSQSGINYFGTVTQNIRQLVSIRKQMWQDGGKVDTKIMINMIIRPETEALKDQFIALAGELGIDTVSMRPLNSNAGLTPGQEIPDIKTENGVITHINGEKRWPCHFPFLRLTLSVGNQDGQIRTTWCPHGWDREDFDIGMYPNDGSVKDQWTSPKMQQIRADHLNQTIEAKSPCATCTDWYYVTRTGNKQKTYAEIVLSDTDINNSN